MKKGTWKKERAITRKFSGGDEHAVPKAGTRKKYWVGNYHRKKKKVSEGFRSNPGYKKKAKVKK